MEPANLPPEKGNEGNLRREKEKSAKFWALHPSGLPPFSWFGLPFGPPPFGPRLFQGTGLHSSRQQFSSTVEQATAPFQYALSSKAGGECIAHALQALTDLNPRTTVLSVDGVGACDLISRGSMLEGLRSIPGGDSVLPFVLQFYGNPSSYLWEDDSGDTHEIRQGEGGEQGDPLMPLLFALGQHRALRSVQSHLSEDERLLAFHDDIYVVSQPERTCELYGILARELWVHSRIRINGSKTQIWNRGGFIPPGHDALLAIARQDDPDAQICLVITLHLSLNAVFVFWVLLWAAMHSSGPNSKPLENPMSCC